MSNKRIIFEIPEHGETKVTTEGFKGDECLKATEGFERALGKVAKRTLTDDYYERPLHNEIHIKN